MSSWVFCLRACSVFIRVLSSCVVCLHVWSVFMCGLSSCVVCLHVWSVFMCRLSLRTFGRLYFDRCPGHLRGREERADLFSSHHVDDRVVGEAVGDHHADVVFERPRRGLDLQPGQHNRVTATGSQCSRKTSSFDTFDSMPPIPPHPGSVIHSTSHTAAPR